MGVSSNIPTFGPVIKGFSFISFLAVRVISSSRHLGLYRVFSHQQASLTSEEVGNRVLQKNLAKVCDLANCCHLIA